MNSKAVLLDTHVFIWLLTGSEALSKKSIATINLAALRNEVYISPMTIWEVGMLVAKQRIFLDRPVLDWIKAALNAPGITLWPLSPEIAIESCALPGDFHGDPVDRILVATAKQTHSWLITRDKKIIAYGSKHHVNVLVA